MRVTIEFSIIMVDYQWLLSFDEKSLLGRDTDHLCIMGLILSPWLQPEPKLLGHIIGSMVSSFVIQSSALAWGDAESSKSASFDTVAISSRISVARCSGVRLHGVGLEVRRVFGRTGCWTGC